MPYGILFSCNKNSSLQAIMLWQRKYGILNPINFIKTAVLPLLFFILLQFIFSFVTKDTADFSATVVFEAVILTVLMYSEAVKSVKMLSGMNSVLTEAVLYEDYMEVTTSYTKEVIYYDEIDLCVEKNFCLCLIYDKCAFPLSIMKMQIKKGSFDVFTLKLKEKLNKRYEKKDVN